MQERGAVMNSPLNPSKFADMLDEGIYATGPKGESLKRERVRLVKWLRKKGKKSQACSDLADKLDQCRRRHRCQSAACPECTAAAQRLIANITGDFLKAQAGGGARIVCVTIVAEDGMVKPGKLSKADHERRIRRWKERLGKGGVTWFVGATDISLNEHKQGRYRRHWSEHFYGLTVTEDPKKLKRELRKYFPKTDAILRPVKIEEWDGNKKALRYILKPNFSWRIANDNGQRFDKNTRTMRSCRDTDVQPLKSKQKRELMVYLDDIGMQSRHLMRHCQLLNLKGRGATLVMRPPKRR
jgi:hypothetical protein